MDYISGASELPSRSVPLVRLQEKVELQRVTDKLSAYVGYVRQLNQHVTNTNAANFVTSTKILDEEIANLKSIYEAELEKLRNEIEVGARNRTFLQTQCSNQQTSIGDLQNKLSHETDKNTKLLSEVSVLQRKVEGLESELHAAHSKLQSPENVDQLNRCVVNLTREVDQWRHRFEHEQLTTRELENCLQQKLKKAEFSDQVHEQEIKDCKNRLDIASATIVSLEAHLQDFNKVPISEVMKQVKEKAEAELRSYMAEADEKYARNLSVLKVRIDSDAEVLQKLSLEKCELTRKIAELQDKIRSLEGQIASLQHQKKTLEDAILAERRKAENSIEHLEKKLRDVQDILMAKMNEAVNVREYSIPLKAEIEALKVLMEEEEARLQMPLGLLSTVQPVILKTDPKSTVFKSKFSETLQEKAAGRNPPYLIRNNLQTSIDYKKTEEMCTTHNSPQQTAHFPLQTAHSPQQTAHSSSVTANVLAPHDSVITNDYEFITSDPYMPEGIGSIYPFEPSPPLDTFYIPEELRVAEDALTYDVNTNGRLTASSLNMPEILLPMTGPQYSYNTLYDQNQLNSSLPLTSRPLGPIHTRAKSAAENNKLKEEESTENAWNIKVNQFKSSQDINLWEDNTFQCFNNEELLTKSHPKSSPAASLHSFLDDLDAATSAIGNLKIKEVSEDGRFVRLLNDGPTEYECSGYTIKQTIHGRPVAVFRFPSETKFPPDSTITVWSAMNDPSLHNPPTDFFWKESQKWETASQCTTVLCRPNGQAVAWTVASHRFSQDPFTEISGSKLDLAEEINENRSVVSDSGDNETLTTIKADLSGPKPEPVFIRREKRQPASLFVSKHPHGNNPLVSTHPHSGQARPLHFGNDNSTNSRQSRAQTIRPDPLLGRPYTGAPEQRIGNKTLRRTRSGQTTRSSSINENIALNKTSTWSAGEISERPSPFSRPWNRFETGLKQIYSQYNPDFLPPMPQPPQISL
ncbi:hypothetical protein BsWGS_07191 [Bradybaena similaris]